jgi:hypothetical protein
MSKTNAAKKAIDPVAEGFDPYALGEDYLKFYQRSFDAVLENIEKMMTFSQNIVEGTYAQMKEWQDNGVSTLEEITKDVRKTQTELYKGMEAGFNQMQLKF